MRKEPLEGRLAGTVPGRHSQLRVPTCRFGSGHKLTGPETEPSVVYRAPRGVHWQFSLPSPCVRPPPLVNESLKRESERARLKSLLEESFT